MVGMKRAVGGIKPPEYGWQGHARAFAMGVTVGAAATVGVAVMGRYARGHKGEEKGTREREIADHPAMIMGAPTPAETLRTFQGFVASWDGRTRTPRWVMERLTKEGVKGDADRQQSPGFAEDDAVPREFRSTLADYRASGYDKGHMAPVMDHRWSQKAMDDTFVLSNVAPQVGAGFNRDMWARLEKWAKDLTKRHEEVFVVTGPLFLPTRVAKWGSSGNDAAPNSPRWEMRYPLLGDFPFAVAVPSAFFKLVLVDPRGEEPAMAAFVMPNARIPADYSLRRFAVRLSDLEAASGLTFFPSFFRDSELRTMYERSEASFLRQRNRQLGLPSSDGNELLELEPLQANEPGRGATAGPPPVRMAKPRKVRHICQEEGACALPPERFWHPSPSRPSRLEPAGSSPSTN